MIQRLVLFVAFILTTTSVAQKDYKGKIIDAQTGLPIPYVNIGIVNMGVGTVSDEKGLFHLELSPGILTTDEAILFSSLGYKPLKIPVSEAEFRYNEYPEIRLTPSLVELQEVVVTNSQSDSEFIDELVGYREFGGNSFGYWKEDNALGGELATRIRVKKGLRKLESFGFDILRNRMDSVLVRINLYDRQGNQGMPFTNLNTSGKNILHKIKKGDTYGRVNLKPYSIFVKDDFIVSLELVKVYGDNSIELILPAVANDSGSFRRYTSQGEWEKISDSGMGYYLETSVLVSEKQANKIKGKKTRKSKRQSKVSGFVISSGRMLAGVEIINMRTKERVETNEKGRYEIPAKEKDILTFNAAGYQTKQFRIGKNPILNVILKLDGL